jgi:hypothetical protein
MLHGRPTGLHVNGRSPIRCGRVLKRERGLDRDKGSRLILFKVGFGPSIVDAKVEAAYLLPLEAVKSAGGIVHRKEVDEGAVGLEHANALYRTIAVKHLLQIKLS